MPSINFWGNTSWTLLPKQVLLSKMKTRFQHPRQRGMIPNISFVSETLLTRISSWWAIADFIASDHQFIFSYVNYGQYIVAASRERLCLAWNTNKLDSAKFTVVVLWGTLAVSPATSGTNPKALVSSRMELIASACDQTMLHWKLQCNKQPVYWWTSEIAELKSHFQNHKHRHKDNRAPENSRRWQYIRLWGGLSDVP